MADPPRRKIGAGSFDPGKTQLFHVPAPPAPPAPPPLPRAQPDWQSRTRVLPIELLVPGVADKAPAPRERTHRLHRPALLSKQRVYAWAACIVLWVSVAAGSGLPSGSPLDTTAASAAQGAVTIRTAVPAAEQRRAVAAAPAQPTAAAPAGARAPSAARREAPATPQPAAASAPAPAPAVRVSARTAVEALAAGDALAAAQFYAALARQHPDNPAYTRAARILMQRLQARDASQGGMP